MNDHLDPEARPVRAAAAPHPRGNVDDAIVGGFSDRVVAVSPAMQNVLRQVEAFAPSRAPVLIVGESGTGKEVVARLLHEMSAPVREPYVRVNCAALAESLVESELFGHEPGAFTGAAGRRIGRFEWAAGGTLLLDEISEVPPRVQAKLLRALEEEEFQRVGGNDTVAIRARVLATSNRCLDEEVAAGRFRQDLYFRLNVLQIVIPPLRERREDIDPLAESFRRTFHTESPRPLLGFTESLVRWMRDYRWPGNVRQLRNLVRRLCLVHKGVWATCDDLPPLPNSDHGTSQRPDALGLCDMTLRDAEQLLIQHALRRFRGNRTAAARHLGISPRTLHNHLRRNPTLDAA